MTGFLPLGSDAFGGDGTETKPTVKTFAIGDDEIGGVGEDSAVLSVKPLTLAIGDDAIGGDGTDYVSSNGLSSATGTLSRTLDPLTSIASGEVGHAQHGLLAKTLGAITLDATGSVLIEGNLLVTLDAFKLTSTAQIAGNSAAALLIGA
jgi:hypothetical protein